MILPRGIIRKLVICIYQAVKDKCIKHFKYENIIICIDGEQLELTSIIEPDFLVRQLFSYKQIDEITWSFTTTTLYEQLVGNVIVSDQEIIYLYHRFKDIEERLENYIDQIVNI